MTTTPIRRCVDREAGFSLLEMMAATAILAMVGLIIGVSLSAFVRSWGHAEAAGKLLERNQTIDRIAETLLRGAVPFEWQDRDTLEHRYVFQGEVDELYLTALSRSYGGADALRFARLYRDGDRLLCDWSTTPLLPWRDLIEQKYDTEEIASGVISPVAVSIRGDAAMNCVSGNMRTSSVLKSTCPRHPHTAGGS